MVDDGRTDGRTDDGRTPDHGHPISSPCEPKGSGELKTPGTPASRTWHVSHLPCVGLEPTGDIVMIVVR